jgi:hypothetical protein
MVSFFEISVLLLCAGALLLFAIISCRFRMTAEKKETLAKNGVDYVIVTIMNYLSPPPAPLPTLPTSYKEYKSNEVRYRRVFTPLVTKGSFASSPSLPIDEKVKFI